MGRDIGKNLITLMDRVDTEKTDDMIKGLADHLDVERTRFALAGKEHKIAALEDKVETIFVLAEGTKLVSEIVQKINAIYSDTAEGIVLSTVHRAKGLEAEDGYIRKPSLFPHPRAKSEKDIIQERNILYVALSRFKKSLSFVEGKSPISISSELVTTEAADPVAASEAQGLL